MSVIVVNEQIELVPVAGTVADKTISSTAVSGNAMPAGTEYVMLAVSGANVRFSEDGMAPTASEGFVMAADEAPEIINVRRYNARKFVRATGTDGVLHVQALRKP